MKSMYRRTLFVLAIAALPGIAAADDAFTLRPADIYAGPDSEYPVIAQLPPNTEVGVAGCLSDWSWCDVTFANARGWVYAGDLGYPYEGRRVAIIEFGPRLHIPAVTFSLVSYWDAHYRSRPFFRERDQWAGRIHVEANRGGHPPHGARVAERAGQQAPSAQAEQHTRERNDQAQTKQPNREAQRAQPTQPQAAEGMRSREEANAPSSGPQHEEAARAQSEPRAQAREQAHGNQSMAQERTGEREARTTPRNEQQARSEPDGGTAKGKQDERSKEERKQAEPQ